MKFHDELNQKLFNKEELKPEVKEKLKEIAEAFIDYLEVNKDAIKDVVITGSSVSYNYTKYSDIDLHLKVDYDLIHEDCPIVEGYLWACKSTFNKDHDITIYGIPVEVYAESIEEDTVHNGLYSLWQDKWIDKPNKIPPTDNDSAVLSKYNELKEAADRIQDSEVASELIDKIYQMRKAGLQEAGEFSTENLAFKKLRDEGIIERLREMKKQKIDKELSLESYNESEDKIKELLDIFNYLPKFDPTKYTDFQNNSFYARIDNNKIYFYGYSVPNDFYLDKNTCRDKNKLFEILKEKKLLHPATEGISWEYAGNNVQAIQLIGEVDIDKHPELRISWEGIIPYLREKTDNKNESIKESEEELKVGDIVFLKFTPKFMRRPGKITKFISDDVVEIEFDAYKNNMPRTDRYYIQDVEKCSENIEELYQEKEYEFEDGTKEGRPFLDFKKVNESIKESEDKLDYEQFKIAKSNFGTYFVTPYDSRIGRIEGSSAVTVSNKLAAAINKYNSKSIAAERKALINKLHKLFKQAGIPKMQDMKSSIRGYRPITQNGYYIEIYKGDYTTFNIGITGNREELGNKIKEILNNEGVKYTGSVDYFTVDMEKQDSKNESIKEGFNKGDKVQLRRKNNKIGIVKSIFNGDKDKNDKDIKYLNVEFEDGTKEGRPASDFRKVNESTGELAVFAKRRFSNVTGRPQKDFYRETDYKLSLEDAEKWINKDMGYDRPGIIYQIRDKEGNVIKEVKWTDIYNTKKHYDEAIKYLYKYGTMDQIAYVLRLANPDIPQEKIDKKIEQLKAAKEYEDIHQQLLRCSIAGIEPSAATRERSAELRRYLDKNESIKEELKEKEYQGCKYTILPDGKYCSIKIYAPKGYTFKNGDTWYSTETELKKADKKAKDIIDNEIELKESINKLEETLKKATDREINEGMWASPFTMENAKQVAELLAKPITYEELNSEEGKQKYWNIIGDDEFWDNVADEAFDIPEADARYLIVKFLEDWIEGKENFNPDAYSQKAEDIIKKAIFMFNGITEDMGKSIKEDRLFNKQLTPLPSKDAKLNKGDKVTIDGQNGEIIEVRPMKMSDTCTYKIKLDNGKVIWRYEEEIINEEVKTSPLQRAISRAFAESEGIYKPSLIYAAYKLEQQWLKSLGLGQDEQAPEIMLFVINNPEEGIEDTKLVKREDVYTYTPEQNEYYLDMTRDSGDVITDYNLEPAAKLVDSWNLKEDAQTLTDKVDKAEQELQDIIKMVKVGYQEDNKLINNLNKLINEALEK